jgi:hypothetical protein
LAQVKRLVWADLKAVRDRLEVVSVPQDGPPIR